MVKEGRSVIQVIKFFGSAGFSQSNQETEKMLHYFHFAYRYSLQQAVQDRKDFIKTPDCAFYIVEIRRLINAGKEKNHRWPLLKQLSLMYK